MLAELVGIRWDDRAIPVRYRVNDSTGPNVPNPIGAPVLTLMNPADRWVRIYVREDEIGRVVIGQRAEIRSDTDPSRSFGGRVTYIAANAEFTPRNVQTTEERVKLVYAVKVQITDDPEMMLKPGVPADVQLITGT